MRHLQALLPGHICAVQVAASGSFTAAAHVLDLTPAAVSKNVGVLEAALQVRLFNRTTRQLKLTPEGERVIARAREGIAALEAAATVANMQEAPRGLVRTSCAVGFGRRFVIPLIARFRALYPHVQIELSLNDQNIDLVRDGFDVGIRGGTEPPAGMVARRFARSCSVLMATPRYLKAHGTPHSWRDLDRHQIIALRFLSGRYPNWQFREGAQHYTFVPHAQPGCALVVSEPEAQLDAVLTHAGIASVSRHHAWAALQSGAVRALLTAQHQQEDVAMSVFYPHRAGLAARVRVWVDFLVASFAANPALAAARSGDL